ncbi:neurobeachin isoform X8 [Siniperca chuatsi]|uniref:neurobeachin isoform X8 n=1 Tax=Siniperca chuatsi TaxID=119488 RepID=UPI001CE1A579|nr:neurobeachin isoform X8 [Siniperca chuatsi]
MTSERPVTMPGSVSLSDRQPPPGHRQHAAAVPAGAGETMMMSGSGSVVLPAGIINPSVPIRNINMKFAVLIGLIQVGEVSNRDIVETVLNLLVGGEFDLETNFIIQDAESIGCTVELLEHCDVTCQAEIWSMFTAILRKSVRNLQTSTEVGLIQQVLLKMSSVDDMIADLLVDMLGVLASYSITVKELKLLFSMLRGEGGLWPKHAVKMLLVLNQMPQRHGPDAFFNFPGRSAAAIALPPIAKWPYQNGFTFNTWFRMDPLNNINVDKDKPYLYCFRTSKGIGYSAHFVGNCLIVTSLKSKGKGFQHCVKYDFQPRKWYMISIVHIYSRWRNSEIRCYVNGQLVSYGDMAWHVNTNDSYDKCFLGSSETADANRVFCGQLGAVYVFSEALNPAQIFAIHQLGPGYKSTFKFKSESDIHLAEHHKQVLYDGKLASSIAFTYNAKATDAQLCLESSPKENASIFVHSPHALMLQDVKATVTHSIHSAIHSIGGIQVLFPLFAQLDYHQLNDSQVEATVCATLLAFLVELLKSSVAMQEQMLGGKGFLVIGYLLEKSSRAHITRAVLEQFLSFAKYLDGLTHGAPLLKQLCDHILFNAAIWIHTPAKVQLSLYTYLSAEFIGTATIYNTIRRVGTVLQLMHALKYYYWAVNPADSSGIMPKGLDGPRPTQKEIISLRAFMLLFLKQLILKDRGVKEDELQSILNYLLTIHEDENLHDVLQLVVALMSEHPASMIPAFDQRNGIRVIYKLMASKSESIRVQSLKVLGYFLKHLGHKRKVEIMHTHSLFTLLGERLMLHTNTVTVTTYNTLYEILTEQVCTQVVHKPHPEPDSTVKIQNPMILKVVATLLKNSAPCTELMEVRRLFLSDMIKLFNNSRENRRCLLQCSVWQDWMFSLGFINPKNSDEQKITEMVYNIFRILLYHAIKYEWGGWRVWVDTLSIAHSKSLHGRLATQMERDIRVDLGFRAMPMTEEQRRQFSPGPRTTMFRIPEFKWSAMHQRLLTDLLFALESDVHVWRSHSTKSVMDFVNSNENIIFVHNTIHLISQMVDNIIIACGGILPLLSAATSPSTELENTEATQGMSSETAITFLSRLMVLVDVLVFSSSLNFSEIEAEKNMSSGGLMRQCLRLVCCVAVRNCLECRQRHRDRGNKSSIPNNSKTQEILQNAVTSSKIAVEAVPSNLSPIKDPDRLLQDVDINRLRAVVFRDVDDSKQAQFLALAVVYFISVLMVSKYRDILEPQRETARISSQSGRSMHQEINSPTSTETRLAFDSSKDHPTPSEDLHMLSSLPHTDSGIGEEQVASILNGSDLDHSAGGPDTMSQLISTLSSEVKKSQESLSESPSVEVLKSSPSIISLSQPKRGINVKEILKSLVAAPVEGMDAGLEPVSYPDPTAKAQAQATLPMQFHSFDRSVVVPVKKTSPGILAVNTVGSSSSTSAGLTAGSTPSIFAAASATPKSMINTTGAIDAAPSTSSSSSFVNGATSKNLPAVQTVAPMPEDTVENMSITTKLERALEKVAPLLRETFVDFAPFLSRTLLGSHGQELLIEGLVCMKSSTSVVELVMLLCSQEWQNSIQKNAGLAFIELINEGRLLCHAMKDHIVRVANEAEFILNRQRAEDVHKHAEFESNCAQYAADRKEEEKMCDHLISAAKHRDHVTANQLKQKIVNILTNKHGAWGTLAQSQLQDFWRLDYWEDDLRRRRRFVRNPFGSTHLDVTCKSLQEYGTEEDEEVKSKNVFRGQTVASQNPETELMLETDDDAVSLLQEKEMDNLGARFLPQVLISRGPVVLSSPAQLVAPVLVARGTLSITTTEIYFEVDEDDPAFKRVDSKVLAYTEGLHGKWMFSEIRAVFSRRYLLQNTAMEVFMANRTSVMFNFPDQATVKKVVYSLPRVGVGTSYGLPQARRISLATPRQLFKSSNMTQRWQRREISNFEYLMFLNTIAGRTYNDLNQYPVFPWVLTNYDSEELDLTLPGNFRDLSKPVGALNPKRAAFYAERYETWEDDQTPPCHYNSHYSTAASTLHWLVRIEPFTTFFLSANNNKFDHPDRTFSAIARSWRNCQRDTSDVKELIPEFYYLPEMFVNSNGYHLGMREDRTMVCDVDLPAWAKKPEDLVRINRMALESEFVSCQLHQWIDLIFGYKQRGPEAVRALNVFHYLTYEGSAKLDSITDPLLREATEAQIQSFGQTPSQLLIEPHPPRSSAMHLCFLPQSPLMFKDQMQQDVIMVLKFPSNSPVTHVAANTLPHLTVPAVVTVTCSRLFAVNRWHNTVGLRGAPGYSLEQAHHLPIEMDSLVANNTGSNKRQITDLVDQSIQITTHCFVVTADNRYILVCGFWDKSFRVYSSETGKLTQIVFGHWDVVTCLARSESYIGGDCYIVSGSRDATLLLWYWSGRHHIIGDNPNNSDYPAPRAVLTGHDQEVVCVSVCAELGLVISGAKEGPCLVHTITGDLLRALEGPDHYQCPRVISVSSEGHCIIYYERGRFCNFSINGKLLAQMEVNDSIRAILLSSDGHNLVTGGDNGVVEVWQACDFKQLYIYPGCDAGIRAMDLSHDQRTLITGMVSGSIVAFNIDFNRWHYEHQNRF